MGEFDSTLGALLLGIFFNTYLYGLVTFQYISYYNTSFNDHSWIKLLVIFMFVLDTTHSASVIYMAWVYCVENFTNPLILMGPVWPFPFTVVVSSVTAFLVQTFLDYRIYRLTKSKILSGCIFFLSLSTLIVGLICGVKVWKVKIMFEMAGVQPLVTAWLCNEVVVDTLITVVLCIFLGRSRTGFHKTNTILKRLMRAAIQTGLLTGIFSICALVSFLKFPTTMFYGLFGIVIGRIYTTTLMDTLLVRHNLRNISNGSLDFKEYEGGSNDIWLCGGGSAYDRQRSGSSGHDSIRFHIRTEVHASSSSPSPIPEKP